jgi:hypothetical protein
MLRIKGEKFMSENIQSIAQGTYTLGQTSATTYQAGPGISITQPSEGVVRISNDETVLWSGTANAGEFTLNETYKNFEKIGITHGCRWAPASRTFAEDAIFDSNLFNIYSGASIIATEMEMSNITALNDVYTHFSITPITTVNDTKLKLWSSKVTFLQTQTSNATVTGTHTIEDARTIYKIYGINRISGGNE